MKHLVVFVLFEFVNDLLGLGVVGPQSFLDNFFCIIASLVLFSAVQDPFDHFLLAAPEVEDEGHVAEALGFLFPAGQILEVAGIAIYQESGVFVLVALDGFVEELGGDLAGHDLPVVDDLLDDAAILREGISNFFPQEVASRNMLPFELFLNQLALGVLP